MKKILEQFTDVEMIIRPNEFEIIMNTIVNGGISQEETIQRVQNIMNISNKTIVSKR